MADEEHPALGRPAEGPAEGRPAEGERGIDRLVKIGQVLGGLAALLTVSFLIYNNVLKSGSPAPPPAVVSATVTHVQAIPGITLRSALNSDPGVLQEKEAALRAAGVDQQEINHDLQVKGVLLEYAFNVQGSAGQAVKLTSMLYNAQTLERVPEEGDQTIDPERFVLHAASEAGVQASWFETPAPGRYYVEVHVAALDGAIKGKGESPRFTITGARH